MNIPSRFSRASAAHRGLSHLPILSSSNWPKKERGGSPFFVRHLWPIVWKRWKKSESAERNLFWRREEKNWNWFLPSMIIHYGLTPFVRSEEHTSELQSQSN